MGDLENLKAEAERLEGVLSAGVERLAHEELGRVRSEIARIEGAPADPTVTATGVDAQTPSSTDAAPAPAAGAEGAPA